MYTEYNVREHYFDNDNVATAERPGLPEGYVPPHERTAEDMYAGVLRGIADMEAGRVLTAEQVRANLAKLWRK